MDSPTMWCRRESLREVNKTVVTVGVEVYNAILQRGPITAWGIANYLDRPVYTIRPRITELKGMGKVKETGTRWCEMTQRPETVWDVVDKQLGLFNP